MKLFLICSRSFYDKIPDIQKELEAAGHEITLPNSYDDPSAEERHRNTGRDEHAKFKSEMLRHSMKVIESVDAVLVLNFNKHGVDNYIGGATFLEMYDAFKLGRKIYLYNDTPEGILRDEIIGFSPVVIHGDLAKVA